MSPLPSGPVLAIEIRADGDGHLANFGHIPDDLTTAQALQALLMAFATLGDLAVQVNRRMDAALREGSR